MSKANVEVKKVQVVGIDLAKMVFQLHGVTQRGKTVLQKRLRRGKLLAFVAQLPRCLIGMEACSGAQFWARECQRFGHEVRLMAPQFVKPYVKTNKNDAADAEAICEAVQRPNMRFVPLKKVEQQDIQCLHRIRQRLVKTRTALVNEVRGLLHEYGLVIAQGLGSFKTQLPRILENKDEDLSPMVLELFKNLWQECNDLNKKIAELDKKVALICSENPVCRRLKGIPGIGVMTATALVAAIGDPKHFKNGRQLSAWLGLVPRQHSSGGKDRLLGISKRGDVYLRTLLIHGGRTLIRYVAAKKDRHSLWIQKLIERRGKNRTAVAIANKNARIVWAMMMSQENYCCPQI